MHLIGDVDWAKVFGPDTPVLEIVVRGTVVYLALFVLIRVVFKRQPGAVGIADLLVVVLIADAAQNAMAGTYEFFYPKRPATTTTPPQPAPQAKGGK